MKGTRLPEEFRLFMVLLGMTILALSACAPATAMDDARPVAGLSLEAAAAPTEAATQETRPQSMRTNEPPTEAPPSPAAIETETGATPVKQPPTATSIPTVTPTVSPTVKPSPTTEPDRTCPETPPLKPEYDRFYLAAKKWPKPDSNIAQDHFWLSKPLPGAGRTLINQRFPYGWDENGRLLLHNGVDVAEDLGTPVLAVADGTVIVAQSDYSAWYGWRCDWYGHLVVLELDETWQDQPIYALYGHVLNIGVEAGQRVSRGDPLAEVGFGGAATNPHLHFEVRVGENAFAATRNPMLWIDPGPTRGVIAGRLVDPEGRSWQGVPLALVSRSGDAEKQSTWSYLGDPQNLSNPDEGWAENFLFSDVKPGEYDIYTSIQGVDYRHTVTVTSGEVVTVEIETAALKLQTPEPTSTSETKTTGTDG